MISALVLLTLTLAGAQEKERVPASPSDVYYMAEDFSGTIEIRGLISGLIVSCSAPKRDITLDNAHDIQPACTLAEDKTVDDLIIALVEMLKQEREAAREKQEREAAREKVTPQYQNPHKPLRTS